MTLDEDATLHFTYISSVERGERNVSFQTIVRLAGPLRVDPAVLVISDISTRVSSTGMPSLHGLGHQ
jgi:transcriptional regulator with XRE-family HTH domain